MAITSSGVISLSDFNTELSKSGIISLNDADVRDLIGKASSATNSMNEYYGASASDAVASWNGNTEVANYKAGGFNSVQPNGTSINSYSIASRTGEHAWPVSLADNQPYAFTSSTTLKQYPGGGGTTAINRGQVSGTSLRPPNINLSNGVRFTNNISNYPNDFTIRSGGAVFPLQKIKAGSNRFRFTVQVGAVNDLSRAGRVTVKIVQAQNCVAVSGGTHAVANGSQIVTQVFDRTEYANWDPIQNPSGSQGNYTQSVDTNITTSYEWLWMEVIFGTSSYQGQTATVRDIFIN